ncbi:MAG: bifunctional riboflavin kinase/FAD synthetase [Candidatus Hydrogenedentes bacterium]|nr:bifunctional riboflavin kinase/FAD synthetase [Candidatus Hydrogenedentota bacterium]
MIVIDDVHTAHAPFPRLALTIGSFDGIHVGHRRILDQVVAQARAMDGTAAALTLRPHPRQVFAPSHAPNLLTSDAQKMRLFAEAGLDVVFVLPFTADTARLAPGLFLQQIIHERCRPAAIVVGHDFRFGEGARGDYEFLCQAAPRYGFSVTQVAPILIDGERVSSTLIRERILEGDLDEAAGFLGRPYSILGRVVPGRGIGSVLGFPTANIVPGDYVVPPHGVYAADVVIGPAPRPAAVNIGIAPTIRHEDITIEAYVLDFSESILEQDIEIVFRRRIRPEKKFASREELVQQIAVDVAEIRRLLDSPESGP